MENGKIDIHRRANTAIFALAPEDRELVLRAIKSMGELSPDRWPRNAVHKLSATEATYVLRVNQVIRVLFRLTAEHTVEILDVVLRDTLESFATQMD